MLILTFTKVHSFTPRFSLEFPNISSHSVDIHRKCRYSSRDKKPFHGIHRHHGVSSSGLPLELSSRFQFSLRPMGNCVGPCQAFWDSGERHYFNRLYPPWHSQHGTTWAFISIAVTKPYYRERAWGCLASVPHLTSTAAGTPGPGLNAMEKGQLESGAY